jgi:type IV pilus biogenesis protein CpaD/CtpE
MRSLLILTVAALVAGCASQNASTPAKPTTTYAATDTPAPLTLAEAQKLGYKIVNEDGQTLYCRETPKLGSHVKKDRICLTEAEMYEARNSNQRQFEDMKKTIGQRKGN